MFDRFELPALAAGEHEEVETGDSSLPRLFHEIPRVLLVI